MNARKNLLTFVVSAMITIVAFVANPPAFAQTVEQQDRQPAGLGGDILDAIERAKQIQIKAFTGSWEGVLTPEAGGPPPFRILFTFGADGTAVVSDAGPPNPQNNTAEHGVWERTGDYEFTLIYKQFLFNTAGDLDSTFKGRVRFKLDPVQMELNGPVKVDFYDPAGVNFLSGAGTVKCTKIRVEPLD
ncbi:MAG: hypothetical protein ACREEM_00420 [Blastocatellia bacterium]